MQCLERKTPTIKNKNLLKQFFKSECLHKPPGLSHLRSHVDKPCTLAIVFQSVEKPLPLPFSPVVVGRAPIGDCNVRLYWRGKRNRYNMWPCICTLRGVGATSIQYSLHVGMQGLENYVRDRWTRGAPLLL